MTTAFAPSQPLCDYTPRLPKPYRSRLRNVSIGAFLAFLFLVPVVTGAAIYSNAPKTLPNHTMIDDTADTYAPNGDEPPVVDAVVEKS